MRRTFTMHRAEDVTGVSGTGVIAEGVTFTDNTTVIRWFGDHASVVVWPSLDDALAIHGHAGRTTIDWDPDGIDLLLTGTCDAGDCDQSVVAAA